MCPTQLCDRDYDAIIIEVDGQPLVVGPETIVTKTPSGFLIENKFGLHVAKTKEEAIDLLLELNKKET